MAKILNNVLNVEKPRQYYLSPFQNTIHSAILSFLATLALYKNWPLLTYTYLLTC